MNPVMRRIALWFSETFVASALEVIVQTIIEVWNFSIARYDLPLSSINISEMNDETENKSNPNATIEELLQITDNLIDFSQDEIPVQNLPKIGEPSGGNVTKCPDILTPLKELACNLNDELEVMKESSFEMQNANDNNDIVRNPDGTHKIKSNLDEENYKEKTLKEDLNHGHGDTSTHSEHQESFDVLKDSEKAETINIYGTIAGNTVQHACDNDGVIREENSDIRNKIPLNVEHSEINSTSTHTLCFENNTDKFPEFQQQVITNKIKEIALDNPDYWPIVGSDNSFIHMDELMRHKETKMETKDLEVGGMKSFSNKQRRVHFSEEIETFIFEPGENESEMETTDSEVDCMKLLSNNQRKVQFSEEIETFIYEPGRKVHHPCVILKSPINAREDIDKRKSCQKTLIIKEVEETSFQTCVVREQGRESSSVFHENHDILETVRRVYDERRAETNGCFSDESDTSDASLERQNRIEGWLQLTTEDDQLLLENMYPICNCSPQRIHRAGDFKASKTGHGNVCFNKKAVTAARKQSKDILDKICKKLFQQKPATRK